jgi:hypothetical protein
MGHGSARRLQPLSNNDISKQPRWMVILSTVSLCTAACSSMMTIYQPNYVIRLRHAMSNIEELRIAAEAIAVKLAADSQTAC